MGSLARSPMHTAWTIPFALVLALSLKGCAGCTSQPLPGEGPDEAPVTGLDDPARDAARQTPDLPGRHVSDLENARKLGKSGSIPIQTPLSPVARPGVAFQTPGSPVPRPGEAPDPDSARAVAFDAEISLEALQRIDKGMTFQEISAIVGRPGITVASDGDESVLYRWSAGEHSFLARFVDNKLTRKTLLARPEATDSAALTEDAYDEVAPGMSLDEVLALLEVPAQPVARHGEETAIYRWTDRLGSSFTARFENGVLVRKTAFVVSPLAKEDTDGEGLPEEMPEGEPDGEAEEEGDAEEREAVVQIAERPEPGPADAPAPGTAAPERAPQTGETAVHEAPSRVRVIGAERRNRDREADDSPFAGRSYRPRVSLPDYTWTLPRGAYEVRITNPTDERVEVGIRSGRHGRDLRVRGESSQSFFVGQGSYRIHYRYDSDPYTIYRGGEINIDGAFTADVEVTLFERDYAVQHLQDDGGYRRR